MKKVIPRSLRIIWNAEKYSVEQTAVKLGKVD